jgi:hypothetical protein
MHAAVLIASACSHYSIYTRYKQALGLRGTPLGACDAKLQANYILQLHAVDMEHINEARKIHQQIGSMSLSHHASPVDLTARLTRTMQGAILHAYYPGRSAALQRQFQMDTGPGTFISGRAYAGCVPDCRMPLTFSSLPGSALLLHWSGTSKKYLLCMPHPDRCTHSFVAQAIMPLNKIESASLPAKCRQLLQNTPEKPA